MNDWIYICTYSGGSWSELELYINPKERTAKVEIFDLIGRDSDGNEEYLQYDAELTIEQALEDVSYSEEYTRKILELLEENI